MPLIPRQYLTERGRVSSLEMEWGGYLVRKGAGFHGVMCFPGVSYSLRGSIFKFC